jgi:class 3 adenylate cyclase/tetratricopeptide (TPR) repeat protein
MLPPVTDAPQDNDIETGGVKKPRPAPRRGRPDLAALFDDIDSKQPAEATSIATARPRRVADLPVLDGMGAEENPPPANSSPAVQAAHKERRPMPDLAQAFGPEPNAPKPADIEQPGLTVPPELEKYLSPELWRKLKNPASQRGVLINALDRVRSILYLLSTFLPGNLVQEKMRHPVAGLVKGERQTGSLLFSDVSGFTALSERLAGLGPEGAERLTSIMNRYFATMLEILAWSGGILQKFAGDATLVYFPEQKGGRQAGWAVRAGQRMLRAMDKFSHIETPSETVSLRMKVGVATGEFLAAQAGGPGRMEYVVFGEAISETMAAEGATSGAGELVVNQATLDCLDRPVEAVEKQPGYYLVATPEDETLDDFEIKAEMRRARGAIPWSAGPEEIVSQIETALRQIEAISPYLAPELVERIILHARQRKIDSEYRPTTVIFINFTGFENLLQAWGKPGTARLTGLLSAYFNALHGAIARYGGIVSRIDPYSKGSKMLVLFGAPVAHEDDPQRAVSAALAMNAELENVNETWRKKLARFLGPEQSGLLIQHRIGITYGDTFAGQVGASTRREYTVMGDDVNLAARLMGAADMGQILISQKVHEAVEDYFFLTPLTPIKVKGKTRPIPIYQVEGLRDDALLGRVHGRGPLAARDGELQYGLDLLRRASEGKGSILTVQGPAGIGKSHLCDAILAQAFQTGGRVALNQCRAFTTGSPYAAWALLLRSLAGITTSDFLPEIQTQKLLRLLDDLAIPAGHAAALARIMGLKLPEADTPAEAACAEEPDQGDFGDLLNHLKNGKSRRRGSSLEVWDMLEHQAGSESGLPALNWPALSGYTSEGQGVALTEALQALLENLANRQTLVIFFEDAHWMDEASRQALSVLGESIGQNRVFILLAERSDQAPAQTLGRLLALEPLDPQGTTALISQLMISELAQIIHEQSGGNPLFVEEITRWFQRTHHIHAAELKSALQTSNILQKLVLSGVETLPAEQREIARMAAVIGMEFRTGEVQVLLPEGNDPVSVSNHLRGLIRARLILLTEAGADARYEFQQALVRDVLYNSMPYEQRRELHARMAEYLSKPVSRRRDVHSKISAALESHASGNPLRNAERIAYHYEQANRLPETARALLTLARQARQAKAYLKAFQTYQRALTILDRLEADEIDQEMKALKYQVQVGEGDCAFSLGDYLAAASAYEGARVLAGARVPADVRVTADAGAPAGAGLPSNAGVPSRARGPAGRGATDGAASGADDSALTGISRTEALDLIARNSLALVGLRKAEEGERLLSQAAAACPDETPVLASASLAWLLWRRGSPEAAFWIEKSLGKLGEEAPAWGRRLKAMLNCMQAELAGDRQAAKMAYLPSANATGVALAALRSGEELLAQGRRSEALEEFGQAGEIWRNVPPVDSGLALALFKQAECFYLTGNLAAARAALETAKTELEAGPPELQAEGRRAIRSALKAAAGGKVKRWPAWKWQAYDDLFGIRLLYPDGQV